MDFRDSKKICTITILGKRRYDKNIYTEKSGLTLWNEDGNKIGQSKKPLTLTVDGIRGKEGNSIVDI